MWLLTICYVAVFANVRSGEIYFIPPFYTLLYTEWFQTLKLSSLMRGDCTMFSCRQDTRGTFKNWVYLSENPQEDGDFVNQYVREIVEKNREVICMCEKRKFSGYFLIMIITLKKNCHTSVDFSLFLWLYQWMEVVWSQFQSALEKHFKQTEVLKMEYEVL